MQLLWRVAPSPHPHPLVASCCWTGVGGCTAAISAGRVAAILYSRRMRLYHLSPSKRNTVSLVALFTNGPQRLADHSRKCKGSTERI